jgi:hypothetical protein
MNIVKLKVLIKEAIKESIANDPVVVMAKAFIEKETHNLQEPNIAKGLCQSVSGKFAAYLIENGFEVQIAHMEIRYLDEDEVAIEHYAVVVDNKIYDLTATQFFGRSVSIPMVFDDADEWVSRIDETFEGKYEYPECYIEEYSC